MKKFSVVLLVVFSVRSFALDHTYAQWAKVLDKYRTAKGLVRYKSLKEDIAKDQNHPLTLFVKDLSTPHEKEYETWSRGQKLAFLINAYNALAMKLVADHYPVASIKDIDAPFRRPFFALLGKRITTLDFLMHNYLRPTAADPRVHACINMAAMSSPALPAKPFLPDAIDTQLETAFRDFLSDKQRNEYSLMRGFAKISKIFEWYPTDFSDAFENQAKMFLKYGPDDAKTIFAGHPQVRTIPFDWALNDAPTTNAAP